jgi:hypothetical protein
MAAKRHKKTQKNYKKLTEANPSYRGYLLKARIRVSSQFSRFLSRFFWFFVPFAAIPVLPWRL